MQLRDRGHIYPLWDLTQEDIEWAKQAVTQDLKWQEAKTYRNTAPHEYATTKANGKDNIDRLAHVLLLDGIPANYHSVARIYWYHDGFRYWTCGVGPNGHGVINRTEEEGPDYTGGRYVPRIKDLNHSTTDFIVPKTRHAFGWSHDPQKTPHTEEWHQRTHEFRKHLIGPGMQPGMDTFLSVDDFAGIMAWLPDVPPQFVTYMSKHRTALNMGWVNDLYKWPTDLIHGEPGEDSFQLRAHYAAVILHEHPGTNTEDYIEEARKLAKKKVLLVTEEGIVTEV